MPSKNIKQEFDIVIVGAGPAGLSMARAASLIGLKIAIIEQQELEKIQNPKYDGREIALTHKSQSIMEKLGMWDKIPHTEISKIQSAKVFNSNDDFFMGLSSGDARQLSYIVANDKIRKAAIETINEDPNITIFANEKIKHFENSTKNCLIETENGITLRSSLLIAADSRFSTIRDRIGLKSTKLDFGKTMIVCRMRHEKPHDYIASECFHIGHTMAILPLNDNCCSMVITAKPDIIKTLVEMPEKNFNSWVMENYQNKLGKMELISARYPYPLIGVYSDNFIGNRFALIGDAAVGMHPVTAHGFNFGLTGIEIMANTLQKAKRNNIDIGSHQILWDFEKNHRRATLPLYIGTAAIVKLYTNDSIPALMARKILIRIADKMRPIKSMIMDKLMDSSNGKPNFVPFALPKPPLPDPAILLRFLKN